MTDRRAIPALGLALLVAAPAAAQTAPEPLSGWPKYLEVNLPDGGPGLCDLIAPPAVYTHAGRADLADLRLYDAAGREVPFALRHRAPRSEFQARVPKEFNRVTHPDGAVEVSLDLGADPGEHNRVEVTAGGANYRRAARLEGGDDGKTWRTVANGTLLYFADDGRTFDRRALTYPPSRFRYLRLTVRPDPGLPHDDPAPVQAQVLREVRDPGLEATWPAALSAREPARAYDGYASEWTLSLPTGEKVPWEVLEFDCPEAEFVRPYRLEELTADGAGQLIAQGQWERTTGERKPLRIVSDRPVVAAKVRLTVVDQRNPPLTLTLLAAKAAADQIVFQRTAETAGPLRLYLGNPSASDPSYDLGRTLPHPPPVAQHATAGDVKPNPDYRPPEERRPPLLDRWPWATHTVFGAVAAVLAGLLAATARQTARRHDAAAVAPG